MTEYTTKTVAGATGLEPAASGVTGRSSEKFGSENSPRFKSSPGNSSPKARKVETAGRGRIAIGDIAVSR